jgi:hypothetical protein
MEVRYLPLKRKRPTPAWEIRMLQTAETRYAMKQRIAKPAPMIAGNAAPVPAIPFAEMESATNTAKRTASHAPRIAVAADLFAVMESAKRKKIANPASGIVSANRFAGMENVSSGKTVRNVPVIVASAPLPVGMENARMLKPTDPAPMTALNRNLLLSRR